MFRDNAARSAGLAANEEGVWLSDQDSIVRLGQEDAVWEPKPGNHTPSFRVAPDGTLYRPFEERVLVDGEWRLQRPDVNGIDLKQRGSMLMAPDGTLWLKGTNGKEDKNKRRPRLARRNEEGWTLVGSPPWPSGRSRDEDHPRIGSWGVTADGTLYVQRDADVQRFDGERWETLERPPSGFDRLHVGPDGTVWVDRHQGGPLMKLAEGGWTRYETAPRNQLRGIAHAEVASDGAYWFTPLGNPMVNGACDGVMRTDGESTHHCLPGLCVLSLTPGPESSVWVQALEWTGDYLRPEAIGALELYAIDPADARSAT